MLSRIDFASYRHRSIWTYIEELYVNIESCPEVFVASDYKYNVFATGLLYAETGKRDEWRHLVDDAYHFPCCRVCLHVLVRLRRLLHFEHLVYARLQLAKRDRVDDPLQRRLRDVQVMRRAYRQML